MWDGWEQVQPIYQLRSEESVTQAVPHQEKYTG